METVVHRQFMAHLEITNKDINTAACLIVLIDLAMRTIQYIELFVGTIPHLCKEWLKFATIFFRRNKINIRIFACEKFLIIPTMHTDSQTTDDAQQHIPGMRLIDQAMHFI